MVSFNPRNILVINFGQLGDVVLSLPALRAIRERFPQARITVAAGRSATPVVELSGYANETLPVDRVALRDGSKIVSVWRIINLVRVVRRRKFDFVIDLHSLSETNILGFLSGAPKRLYSRRQNRSLDFLGNVALVPYEDKSKHVVDRYLDVLRPLGLPPGVSRETRLRARMEDNRFVEDLLRKEKIDASAPLVGLFPGAGHSSRRWNMEQFAELARRFHYNDGVRTILFAGPEERALVPEMRRVFGRDITILDRLTIPQLAAALARLSVFIANDTGPVHIAAATGTPTVVLINRPTENGFNPIGSRHHVIYKESFDQLTVEEVYEAARRTFTSGRVASLFSE